MKEILLTFKTQKGIKTYHEIDEEGKEMGETIGESIEYAIIHDKYEPTREELRKLAITSWIRKLQIRKRELEEMKEVTEETIKELEERYKGEITED